MFLEYVILDVKDAVEDTAIGLLALFKVVEVIARPANRRLDISLYLTIGPPTIGTESLVLFVIEPQLGCIK